MKMDVDEKKIADLFAKIAESNKLGSQLIEMGDGLTARQKSLDSTEGR